MAARVRALTDLRKLHLSSSSLAGLVKWLHSTIECRQTETWAAAQWGQHSHFTYQGEQPDQRHLDRLYDEQVRLSVCHVMAVHCLLSSSVSLKIFLWFKFDICDLTM